MFETEDPKKKKPDFLSTLTRKLGVADVKVPGPIYTPKPVQPSAYETANKIIEQGSVIPVNETREAKRARIDAENAAIAKKAKIDNSFIGKLGNFVGGLMDTGVGMVKNIATNPKGFLQSFPREFASVGVSAGEKIRGTKNGFIVPSNSFEKAIFGKEPIYGVGKEVGSVFDQSAKDLEDITGAKKGSISESKGYKNVLLPIFVGSTVISDIFSGGSSKAARAGLEKRLLTEATEDGVRRTLREANVAEHVIDKYADSLAKTKDAKVVTQTLNDLMGEHAQYITDKAINRLDELEQKKTGVRTDPDTGKEFKTDPVPLSAAELAERKFLKKNISKPEELNLGFQEDRPKLREVKQYDNVSTRNTDELVDFEGAPDRSQVNKYMEDIRAGKEVDPLILKRQKDGTFGVEDGKHRLAAYKELGIKEVPVVYKNVKPAEIVASKIDATDRNIMTAFIDSVLAGKKPTKEIAKRAQDIAEAAKMPNAFGSSKALAGDFQKVIEADRANTKRAMATGKNISGGAPVVMSDGVIYKNKAGKVDQVVKDNGKVSYDDRGGDKINFGGNESNVASPKNLEKYGGMRKKLSDAWTNITEKIQDKWVRVKKAIDEDGKVDFENNPYITETLYHGRLGSRIESIKGEAQAIVDDIQKTSKQLKVDTGTISKEVNEYLVAKHAPERNAKLGDGAAGMTDEVAQETMDRLKESPRFKEIKAIADKVTDMNKQTLDILYADGNPWGLIDKETYDKLRSEYKNHVPLNRIMEEVGDNDIGGVISGKGIDVRGSGLKRARGSSREVADILTNVVSNVAQATTRIEKNLINYDMYKYAVENPKNGWVKARGPIVEIGEDGKPLKRKDGSLVFKPENDPNILQMVVEGKTKYLEFADPHMAQVVKGVATEFLPPVLAFVGSFTRLLSNLATRFNPEFWVTNKFRDLEDVMVFASSQKRLKVKKQLAKQLKLEGERAVLDHLRGKDTPGAKMYQEMLDNGGTTGGMSLSTRKQVEVDIEAMKKLAASKPRKAFEAIAKKIDQTNEVFENSTRFVVYKQAIENGASAREAAYLAKESTVNFNRKGTAGPVINALYMFSNASIQGMAKSFKALKNPKTLAMTVGTITAATFAINQYNESIDPEWDNKISDFEKSGGVTILLPGTDKNGEHNRIVIPLAYSLRFIKASADALYGAANNDGGTPGEALGKITAALADGYNPLGGDDLASTVTPTIADLPVEIARNKKWSGSKIRPDFNQNLPASRQYFDSLKDTKLGQLLIAGAKELSDKANVEISPEDVNYVLEQLTGGAGGFVKKVANVGEKAATGKEIKLSEVPFASRFVKEGDPQALEKFGNKQDRGDLKDVKQEQATATFDRQQQAQDILSGLEGKSRDEISSELKGILKTDKPLAEEIIKQAKEKGSGLTTEDKQIRSLDIKNGGRAKYIAKKLDRLKTPEAKKAYLLELAKKKLVTKEVLLQIAELGKPTTQE